MHSTISQTDTVMIATPLILHQHDDTSTSSQLLGDIPVLVSNTHPFSVIFTGRSWCGLLCPMGAATEWVNKVELQRAIPRWMRREGTPIISFLPVSLYTP